MSLSFSQKEYSLDDVSSLGISLLGCASYGCNCIIASGSDGPGVIQVECQTISNTKERYGICQYSECIAVDEQTGEEKNCIFPFK